MLLGSELIITHWPLVLTQSTLGCYQPRSSHQEMPSYADLGKIYSGCSTRTYNVLQRQASGEKAIEAYLCFNLGRLIDNNIIFY